MDQAIRFNRWTWAGDGSIAVSGGCWVLFYSDVLNPWGAGQDQLLEHQRSQPSSVSCSAPYHAGGHLTGQ